MTGPRALSVAILFLCSASGAFAQTTPAPDPWVAWSDNFNSVMTACTTAAQANCLSKAFTSRERPAAAGTFVIDDLARDVRTAEVLVHQQQASDAMWKLYGVDSSAYLGTGFSVPLVGVGANNYEAATQREFFVPNLCAEALDATLCPKKDAGIWTWHLTSQQLAQWADKPILKLLHTVAPMSDWRGFTHLTAGENGPNNLPTLLIRFGALQPSYYKGTFGRPDAVRVFFADYDQTRTKTLRAAMTATGASTLLDNPDPTKTFYIWIYSPDANTKASVASWKELFRLLGTP
ncbi:MAG TPA: hypothetical protein VGG48_08400 [Rhizomicrobium sp.]|jgi:hypothetical protein